MAGFTELSALYNSYRVTVSRIKVETINPSVLTPLEVVVCPTNLDPGASPSGAYCGSLKLQPYAVSKQTGLAGSPKTTVDCTMSTEKIFGSSMVYYDDNFSSLVTTVPNNNWFWVVGFVTANLIPTNSVQFTVTIEVGVEFFDRVVLLA